jgi:F0F1-type ATP synthase assembly protein I
MPEVQRGIGESCVAKERDPGSALAAGMMWASRITSVALGFSLPPLLGYALDRWWNTTPVATMVGAVLGFVSGMFQTMRLASDLPGGKSHARDQSQRREAKRISDSEEHDGLT